MQKTMQEFRVRPIEVVKDLLRSGRPAQMDSNDKAYVAHLACSKSVDFGDSEELWTLELLRWHIREHISLVFPECSRKEAK